MSHKPLPQIDCPLCGSQGETCTNQSCSAYGGKVVAIIPLNVPKKEPRRKRSRGRGGRLGVVTSPWYKGGNS